jgi:5-methylcytosine-specific restriction endonuclease McrA
VAYPAEATGTAPARGSGPTDREAGRIGEGGGKRQRRARGRKTTCQYCGRTFVAAQEYRGYSRKYCSAKCTGQSNAARARAQDPPREVIWTLYEIEGLSDREVARRFGRSHQWALKVRRHYGIDALPRREQNLRRHGGPTRRISSKGYVLVSGPGGEEFEHRLVAERKLGRRLRPGEVVHHIDGDKTNNQASNLRVFASHSEHMRFERPRKPPKSRAGERALKRVFNLRLKGEDRCRNCGRGGPLHLHHAVPRSMSHAARTELLNGLPLCPRCHSGWHQRVVTIYRDVFTEAEWQFISAVELFGQRIGAWIDDRYPDRGLPFRQDP